MKSQEFNFDGLIGPTHNYAGLSFGNVASAAHQNLPSNPRAAALQGLEKMRTLAAMGIPQAILPPILKPDIPFLKRLGFEGSDSASIIQAAFKHSPQLVAQAYSAANMWTANAATVSPAADCFDGRLHLTPANLASTLHRSLEAWPTTRVLRQIFSDPEHFVVHDPLDSAVALTDEGAANHTRLCPSHDSQGLELFVYGSHPLDPRVPRPQRFPSRQTLLAYEAIARHHKLDLQSTFFWQQNPVAIDAGVFHNDVISVGNGNVLLCHELAFLDQPKCLSDLKTRFEAKYQTEFHVIQFSNAELSMEDAVKSYLFNSQLVTRPDGGMTLICPTECQENSSAKRATDRILAENNPITEVRFLNLRQSMNNGGGPACLRLRVVMTEQQSGKMHQGVRFNDQLDQQLSQWVSTHYRETLSPEDLVDPQLIDETRNSSLELEKILKLNLQPTGRPDGMKSDCGGI